MDHDTINEQLGNLARLRTELEFRRRKRHHTSVSASMSAHTHPLELMRLEKHHELDGFVHQDAHDAFLPDDIEGEQWDSESSDEEDESESFFGSPTTSRKNTPRPSMEISDLKDAMMHEQHDGRLSLAQGLTIELTELTKREGGDGGDDNVNNNDGDEDDNDAVADQLVKRMLDGGVGGTQI